jgi:polyhydroxyalkanoate synthesis repressor PhaR
VVRSSTSKPNRSGKGGARNGATRAVKTGGAKSGDAKKRRGRPPRAATDAAQAAFPGERLIHRYGNRRFYDLRQSRAVTIDEIAGYIRAGENVRVIDVDAGNADITRRVLTQIILESGNRQRLELLPIELLTKIITMQDEALSDWLQQYLAAGAHFLERSAKAAFPAALNLQESVAEMMGRFMPDTDAERAREGVPRSVDVESMADELRELRRRLDEMTRDKSRRS